jgi:aminoglycoside phosphotransferase (APT) family kinase protein
METATDITALKTPSGRGVIRADAAELAEALRDPEALLADAAILKDSRSTKAGVATWPGAPERRPRLFVKRHNIKSRVHAAKYAFRTPRAFREFRASARIEALGLPTPKPLAALATRRGAGLLPGPSYFVSEAVEGAVPTLDFFRAAFSDEALAAEYAAAVAGFLARMHDAGVIHGDAKCSNFFAARTVDGYAFGLWDLLSCRFRGTPAGNAEREKEVGRFADSLAAVAERLSMELPETASRHSILDAYAANGSTMEKEKAK